jgi:hypothetical protein
MNRRTGFLGLRYLGYVAYYGFNFRLETCSPYRGRTHSTATRCQQWEGNTCDTLQVLGQSSQEGRQMKSDSLLREVALVIGAIVLGAVSPNVIYPTSNVTVSARDFLLTGAGLCLLLYGFGLFQRAWRAAVIRLRRNRWPPRKVGVLSGLSEEPSDAIPMAGTDVSAEEWAKELQLASDSVGRGLEVKCIRSSGCFDSYCAIVNPYGANYPETSFDGFPVYGKILEYVRRGGLFVNVADVPTYFAYNPRLKRMLDRTPAYYDSGTELRPFKRTPLMEELGLSVLNVEHAHEPQRWLLRMAPKYADFAPGVATYLVRRAVTVTKSIDPVLLPEASEEEELATMFFCNYGEGRCLISLSFLSDDAHDNMPLVATIAKVVVKEVARW